MPTMVFASKTTTFTPETVNTDGSRKPGTGQVTWFVLEELDNASWLFWSNYCKTMKAKVDLESPSNAAIKGFENALALFDTPKATVYVAYSVLDLAHIENPTTKLEHKHIQMCMTVTTSKEDRFWAVTHMGIFRNPMMKEDPKQFGTLGSRGIAMELHSFAAQAITRLRPLMRVEFMITAPLPYMGGLFEGKGKIEATGQTAGPTPNHVLVYQKSGPPFAAKLAIQYNSNKYQTGMANEPWLFMLSFNPSHAYGPAFVNHATLRGLHTDMYMATR